jgi:hypothetical protein
MEVRALHFLLGCTDGQSEGLKLKQKQLDAMQSKRTRVLACLWAHNQSGDGFEQDADHVSANEGRLLV